MYSIIIDEKGITLRTVLFMLIAILVIISIFFFFFNNYLDKQDSENIKANMLVIQGKCKVSKEKSDIKTVQDKTSTDGAKVDIPEDETIIYGKKVSELKDSDEIIKQFLTLNIINDNEQEQFYVLADDDLEKMECDFKNEPGAYYLVNYSNGEVIITSGVDGKYKISEMVDDKVTDSNMVENQSNQNTQSEESDSSMD